MEQVISIFPTPIMKIDQLLNQEMVDRVIKQSKAADRVINTKSERLSHTHVVNPEADDNFKNICELVNPKLVEFGELLFGEKLNWKIKEMWVNILDSGGHQALHSHANSFISGIIYLTKSHPSSRTVFFRNMGGSDFTFSNNNPDAFMGEFNAPKWAAPEALPGDLVLFPSYLLHEVPKNQGEQRMTIALNAIPDRLKIWDYEIKFI